MKRLLVLLSLVVSGAVSAQVYIDYRHASKTHQIGVYGVFIDGYRGRYHHAPENRSMGFYSPPIVVPHPYQHRYSPVQGQHHGYRHEYRHNYNYHYHQYGGCPLVFDHRRMMNVSYCGEYR